MKMKHFLAYALMLAVVYVSGCNSNMEQKKQSTVSVSGTGTVSVKPDMIQMNISLSKTAPTTKQAQEDVSKMVRQVLNVLKSFSIEDKNISTASLTFNPEYEYRPNRRVLTGQRAEQRITFSINDIQNDSVKVPQIIDRLVQINGIELNSMNFGVEDNAEYFVKSRELAFQKALQKAQQYAELSGLKAGKVLSISEEGNQQFPQMMNNRMMFKQEVEFATAADASSTVLPSGELEVTTKILAVFLLE
jgi:uncharacterized protein YggE